MDTNRLKRFATEARNILMQGVAHRFTALGFLPDGTFTEEPQRFEGGATFMGETVTVDFFEKWQSLARAIRQHSLKEVAEEAAYTWFNRLMAIRIMVKNQLIPPVLQYESEGVFVPLIVTEARQGRLPEMKEDERRKLMALLDDDSQTAEQFRILIVAFCHDTPVINACFGHITDYTELLLPANILAEGGFIDLINHTDFIAEEDYKSPELIGWLYQFYISEKKDDVFASFKKGKKADAEDIPAATQIFTPNWVVKYMVQNTIGRIYLENNPYETDIQKKWKYLIEQTEKTPDESILHYEELKELKFGDLACGSGHILNEGFDIFYDLYILEGYSRKDAIENIFRYNLTGIDIDTRAKQLAQFALLLKACQKDASFSNAHIMPRVLDMPEPYSYKDNLQETLPKFFLGGNQEMIKEVCDAIDLMDQAKNLGSIMKFDISERTRNAIYVRMEEYDKQHSLSDEFEQLKLRMRIILALTDKYAAICMNPPYMGNGNMNVELSNYVKQKYEAGKADLCTVCMMVQSDRTIERGFYANIIPPSWMFLSTFENLRRSIINGHKIESMLHLSRGVFGADFGSVSTVIRNSNIKNAHGIYFRLIERTFQEFDQKHLKILFEKTLENHDFRFKFNSYSKDVSEITNDISGNRIYYSNILQDSLKMLPGFPIVYWVPSNVREIFMENNKLSAYSTAKNGMTTGDNNRFLRFWHEVSNERLSHEGHYSPKYKWYSYNKGGYPRRWYGNLDCVINWENNGKDIRKYSKSILRNPDYYFRPSISWSLLSSSAIGTCFRYNPQAALFDVNGMSLFHNDSSNPYYIISLLNSKVAKYLLNLINPTMALQCGDTLNMPCIVDSKFDEQKVKCSISISKLDWDAHETSWDFERNELLTMDENVLMKNIDYLVEKHHKETGEHLCIDPAAPDPNCVEWCYDTYCTKWERLFEMLHSNEEELNSQFIDIYGLQDELSPVVPKDEITILQEGEISIEDNKIVWHSDVVMKQLISYAIGCMMGRYSIDKPGLILANQGDGMDQFNEQVPASRFEPDDDGIIPLMSAQSDFTDNATICFKQWLVAAFGDETLVENLNFIEKSLGKSVDDYFVKDFWKDHKKMYQNRPIYWLFSSKKGAFQCIAYMHRMDAYTAERIRTKYLLPHIEWLLQKQSDMEANAVNLNARERRELDSIGKQIEECREYHDRLHVIADQQIAFDLDDGVVVNHAKFGDVLAKLK